MNLFDTLNEALTDDVVSKIAKLTDEEPEKTRKALDGIFYTLIAGLVRRTGSTMSVSMLYNQVQKGNYGGELIGDVLSFLNKKDKLDSVLKSGDGLVSQVFPAYKSPLISMIGTYAGIKKNSSTMYSSLATPILIDAVSREINTQKMDVEALAAYLAEHHEPLFKKVPEELLEKMIPQLGLQELLSPKFASNKKVVSAKPISVKSRASTGRVGTSAVVEEEEELSERSPFPLKLLLIFLVLAVVIAGGVYWYKNYYEPSLVNTTDDSSLSVDSTSLSTDSLGVTSAASDSVAVRDTTVAAAAIPTTNQQSSVGAELAAYMADKTKPKGQVFSMAGVAFVKGSQAFENGADAAILELAELMKNNPRMQVQIQGHSNDAVGLDNKTMATKRAFAIKKKLLSQGITDTRIDAIGTQGNNNTPDVRIVSK